MRRYRFVIVLLVVIVILLLALLFGGRLRGSTTTPTLSDLIKRSEIAETQIVYYGDSGHACDPADGWSTSHAFADSSAGDPFYPWCIYRCVGPTCEPSVLGSAVLRLQEQVADVPKSSIGPDQMVLQMSAPTPGWEDETLYPTYQRRFADQVGRVEYVGGPSPKPTVRLALIDSSEDSLGEDVRVLSPANRHGYGLANLAANMLCVNGGGECPVQFQSLQVLARQYRTTARTGAYVDRLTGTLADLADALDEAVIGWKDTPEPLSHLVINLSVGWNPRLTLRSRVEGKHKGGGPVKEASNEQQSDEDADALAVKTPDPSLERVELAEGAQLVQDALLHARCSGAAIFAAAGNLDAAGPRAAVGRGADGLDRGMLFPAAWAKDGVNLSDSPNDCKIVDHRDDSDDAVVPLVYAIGAVQPDLRPLAVSRPEGQPPMVAAGDHAVAQSERGELLDAMTGTSVSTIVASATAAALWTNNPDWDVADLDKQLWDGRGAVVEDDSVDVSPAMLAQNDGKPPPPGVLNLCMLGSAGPVYALMAGETCSESTALSADVWPDPLATADVSISYLSTETLASASDEDCDGMTFHCPARGETLTSFGLASCRDRSGVMVGAAQSDSWSGKVTCIRMQGWSPADALDLRPQPDWPECSPCLVRATTDTTISVILDNTLLVTEQVGMVQLEVQSAEQFGANPRTDVYPLALSMTTSGQTTFALRSVASMASRHITRARISWADKSGQVSVVPVAVIPR